MAEYTDTEQETNPFDNVDSERISTEEEERIAALMQKASIQKTLDDEELFDEICNDLRAPGKPYCYPRLTELVNGKMLGTVDIWIADTSVGKSTFTREEILNSIKSGDDVFPLMLEESTTFMLEKLAFRTLGEHLPWKKGSEDFVNEGLVAQRKEMLRKAFMQPGMGKILLISDHSKLTLEDIPDMFEAAALKGIKYMYFDNLTAATGRASSSTASEWERIKQMIVRFQILAPKYNIHITVVCHSSSDGDKNPGGTGGVQGGRSVMQMGDNCFLLRKSGLPSEELDDLHTLDYRTITITKNRQGQSAGKIIGLSYNGITGDIQEYPEAAEFEKLSKKEREAYLEKTQVEDPLDVKYSKCTGDKPSQTKKEKSDF